MSTEPAVRAGCYLRISSDPDDKREGVERQREDTTILCEVRGWVPAAYYIDNDRSASSGKERPEWNRLLADVKAGKVDAIAAWDQDRNWRMMHDLEDLRRFFTSLGRQIPLATTGQGDIDLYSPTGVMMAQIKTAVSEHEIAMMRVRQLRAARQKAEQGVPKWRNAFGYRWRDKHDTSPIELDPVTAPLVEKVYTHVLAGGSISDGTRMLNDAGAYGRSGKPWTTPTLSLFLRKPRNAGLRSHNKVIVLDADGRPVRGAWPPLVSESVWRAVQDVLSAEGRAPGPKSVQKHLLTGVMRCGRDGCDGRLGGGWNMEPQKNGDTGPRAHSIVYACRKCRRCSVRAEYAEPLMMKILVKRLGDPNAKRLVEKSVDPAEAERIRVERIALDGAEAAARSEYRRGIIPGDMWAERMAYIDEQRAELNRQQQDETQARVLAGLSLGRPDKLPAELAALSPDRYRAVIDLIVEVTVQPIGKSGRVFRAERILDGVRYKA